VEPGPCCRQQPGQQGRQREGQDLPAATVAQLSDGAYTLTVKVTKPQLLSCPPAKLDPAVTVISVVSVARRLQLRRWVTCHSYHLLHAMYTKTAANLQHQPPATHGVTPTVADSYPAASDESGALHPACCC
jgi:hypothetical protein